MTQNPPFKIALDIRKIGQQKTGDETYITNLVKQLLRLDQKNIYYLLTDSLEQEARAERILGELPENFEFENINGGKLTWTRKALPKFAKKEGIDLVHVQYIAPWKLKADIKLVTTIHDVSFARFPEYIRWKDRMLLKKYIPKSLKRADKIITVSNFSKEEIENIYGDILGIDEAASKKENEAANQPEAAADKVITIYNGVDEKRFKEKRYFDKSFLERLQAKYKLGERYIFHVSSLQPRKNVPALLEAFKKYLQQSKDPKTNLIIGGAKGYNYDENIEKVMRDLTLRQRVKMIGYVRDDELPALYAGSSLYVSPSLYEGFDLPLLEEMRSGVPILASYGSCHEEIIQDVGLMEDPFDVPAFAEKIDRALNDQQLRKYLIMLGKKRAKKFSWEKCAKETLELYEQLNNQQLNN